MVSQGYFSRLLCVKFFQSASNLGVRFVLRFPHFNLLFLYSKYPTTWRCVYAQLRDVATAHVQMRMKSGGEGKFAETVGCCFLPVSQRPVYGHCSSQFFK